MQSGNNARTNKKKGPMSEDHEDKIMRELRENQMKRDRDWSALNSQVVGGENFYDVAKQLPPQSTDLEQKWEDDRQHLQQRIAELERELAELRQYRQYASSLEASVKIMQPQLGKQKDQIERLEKENAELRAETHRWSEADKQRVRDYDALSLQVVRLRQVLAHSSGVHWAAHSAKGSVHDLAHESCKQALAETPSQAAKEVLGPVVDLLNHIELSFDGLGLEFSAMIRQRTRQLSERLKGLM